MQDTRLLMDLCAAISGRMAGVDWGAYTPDDWRSLCQAAVRQRVAPLLHWSLQDDPEQFPHPVREFLAHQYYQTCAYNQLYFHELDALLERFSREGLPVILLKGAALARSLYPDPGLRPMKDLDLLVHPADLERAVALAGELGYRQEGPEITPGFERRFSNHKVLFKQPSRLICLELHWRLMGTFECGIRDLEDRFWAQVEPLQPGALYAFTLKPAAQILFLCAHAFLGHGPGRVTLRWLADLDRLIRLVGSNLDWDRVLDQACSLGWEQALAQSLALLRLGFATPIPDTIYSALDAGRWTGLFEVVPSEMDLLLGQVKQLSGIERLRYVWWRLFPSPAYMRRRYSLPARTWAPLCYPYRWFRFIRMALNK